jgi:hypothetical protein
MELDYTRQCSMEYFNKQIDILSVLLRVAEEDGKEKSTSKLVPLTPKGTAPLLTLHSSFKRALILRVAEEEKICPPLATNRACDPPVSPGGNREIWRKRPGGVLDCKSGVEPPHSKKRPASESRPYNFRNVS